MSTTIPTSSRRRLRTWTALAAAAALPILGVAAAPAASAAPAETRGWARVAHLSPDTKSVDVQMTALAGGDVVYELDDVAYGAVSDYIPLAEGTYVVSMVPSDAAEGTEPVVEQSVQVTDGDPLTVAAYGANADLQTVVFDDDLSAPASGESRVRVVQASTTEPVVSVETAEGDPIAENVPSGSATDYASVDAGGWNLDLIGADATSTTDVKLASGSVTTLFVLDTSSGALTAKAVTDSATLADVPVGGIETGGGATAPGRIAPADLLAFALLAVGAASVVGVSAVVVGRARRGQEAR